jgi:hypothetical protein
MFCFPWFKLLSLLAAVPAKVNPGARRQPAGGRTCDWVHFLNNQGQSKNPIPARWASAPYLLEIPW